MAEAFKSIAKKFCDWWSISCISVVVDVVFLKKPHTLVVSWLRHICIFATKASNV